MRQAGPAICDCKYVEDTKAARIVRVWDDSITYAKKHRPKGYQGIIRCRAGAGVQGRPRGDGKPAGPDRPLGKGVGGIKTKESPQTNV